VADVRKAIKDGTKFHTETPTGVRADVERFECCGVKTIRSTADALPSNNLDNLRTCAWKSN
jgi:hypothetical protein